MLLIQANAANGRDPNATTLRVCQCPPCFTAFAKGNGIECTPKCDLNYCDEDTGVCSAEGNSGIVKPCNYCNYSYPFAQADIYMSLLGTVVEYISTMVGFVLRLTQTLCIPPDLWHNIGTMLAVPKHDLRVQLDSLHDCSSLCML